MRNDVRLALRQLAAAKGFTLTAVLTLALGIGANTGIFTLIHAVMLKSLPVADPASVVRVGDGDELLRHGRAARPLLDLFLPALSLPPRAHARGRGDGRLSGAAG